ncbi:unnamed protein product [Gongylonema pulchrum]|uniref:Hexosyltransferase n=1 Tax=Gongylonema pulchrum TaxID=637853 RepID=A0A183D996_9BILA|nr:unnamed protein product [Gongylonema pulchrum]
MWLRFVDEFCPRVPYILKMDDDVVVNLYGLMKVLQMRSKPNSTLPFQSNTIACAAWQDATIVRENSKWMVPYEIYPYDGYPVCCNGWYYLMKSELVDDVHITGHMAQRVGAQHESWIMVNRVYPGAKAKPHILFVILQSMDERKKLWRDFLSLYGYQSGSVNAQQTKP